MNGALGGFYRVCEWTMKLVYVNVLWIAFTLLGFIALGIMPSTTSLYAIVRKWIMGEMDIPIFKTFWKTFRTDFIKANLIGFILLVIGIILYVDILFFKSSVGIVYEVLLVLLLGLGLLYLITLMYIFPVFVHYRLTMIQYFKIALVIGISNLQTTLMMVVGIGILYILFCFLPGLVFLFSGVLLSFTFMWFAFKTFTKIDRLKQLVS